MNIKDLTEGQKSVEVVGMITDVTSPRTVSLKAGGTSNVADATLMDEKGDSIKLSLWNEDIESVAKGVKVRIKNGYVSSYRGEKQLSVGKYGTLEII